MKLVFKYEKGCSQNFRKVANLQHVGFNLNPNFQGWQPLLRRENLGCTLRKRS